MPLCQGCLDFSPKVQVSEYQQMHKHNVYEEMCKRNEMAKAANAEYVNYLNRRLYLEMVVILS